MTKQPKIGIVLGKLDQPRIATAFDLFSSKYDVHFYAIDTPELLNHINIRSKLWLYEDLKNMPDYMRGIEDQIADCDLLIGVDSSRLATFQMVKIAQKHQIPTAVLVREYHPHLYINLPNIRAIQTDVLQNADTFWPLSNLGASMLKFENVLPERICPTIPYIDQDYFKMDPKLRNKFRSYIGLNEDDFVFLYQGPLDPRLHLDKLCAFIRVAKATDPHNAQRIKLIIAGDGAASRDLKYFCHDHRLGRSVLFLQQDAQPFLRDLYNAVDVRFVADDGPHSQHDTFPLDVLESAACGVIPVLKLGSQIQDQLTSARFLVADFEMETLVGLFSDLIDDRRKLDEMKSSLTQQIKEKFSAKQWLEVMQQEIEQLLNLRTAHHANEYTSLGSAHKIGSITNEEELATLNQQIQVSNLPLTELSRLLTIKGQYLESKAQVESSISAYEQALQYDHNNADALKSLGYIALKGYSHEEAILFFKKALANNDRDASAIFGIALIHQRLHLHQEALFWLEKGIMAEGLTSRNVSLAIQICLEPRIGNRAIEFLENLLEQFNPTAPLLTTLGQLYMRAGKILEGKELLERANQIDLTSKSA